MTRVSIFDFIIAIIMLQVLASITSSMVFLWKFIVWFRDRLLLNLRMYWNHFDQNISKYKQCMVGVIKKDRYQYNCTNTHDQQQFPSLQVGAVFVQFCMRFFQIGIWQFGLADLIGNFFTVVNFGNLAACQPHARAVGCHGGFWAEFLIQGAALPVALALRPGILENLKLCTTWDQAWMVTLFMPGRMRLNIFSVDSIWRIHDSMITDHSSDSGSCHAGLLDFTMIIIS